VKPRHVEPPRDTRVDLSHGSFPGLGYKVAWQLLLGAAITALLLVAALAGLARRRAVRGRRREEDPGPLPEPVEARPLVRG
jgi:hypothetical protein